MRNEFTDCLGFTALCVVNNMLSACPSTVSHGSTVRHDSGHDRNRAFYVVNMDNISEYILDLKTLIILTLISCVVALQLYLKFSRRTFKSTKRLRRKTVIVTGSNTGIGKEAARDFAQRGARVILACRDLKKASQARDDIMRSTGSEDVVVRHLDLASLSSVRQFAEQILATESRLDVLVNNAGAAMLGEQKTKDGLLMGMQVNHFGPFLLTNLLLDLLKQSAPSRIIFVSSLLHRYTINFDVANLNKFDTFFKFYTELQVYSCSKLANVLTSNELSRKLSGTGVTVNSLEPGTVQTEIWRGTPFWAVPITQLYLSWFCKTVEQGAQTTIYLAVSDEVEGVTGKYFSECKEAMHLMCPAAKDERLARKLWEKSENLVNLQPSDVTTLKNS